MPQRRGAAGPDQAARVRGVRHECTPRNPLGATMVSSEGACAAYYLYRRLGGRAAPGRRAPLADSVDSRRSTAAPDFAGWTCPAPLRDQPRIVMGHGGGGHAVRRTRRARSSRPAFGGEALGRARRLRGRSTLGGARLAFSTDSYVVRPLFFPGGCIGDLAVNGTVNDLAMSGARAAYLSCGFILEEGVGAGRGGAGRRRPSARPRATAGVEVVTGDTKVVEAGHGDGIYVNTAGIGLVPDGVDIRPAARRAGRRRDRQRGRSACTAWPS